MPNASVIDVKLGDSETTKIGLELAGMKYKDGDN